MTVATPLHVQKVVNFLHLFERSGFVISVTTAVPASPYRRGVNINHILREIAASNCGLAGRIQRVRDSIQFSHERANLFLVKLFKVTWPIVFISQTPNNHSRMIAMLIDHVSQHASRLVFVTLAAETAATPGN